ncbi:MAG: phosphoglycerate kinase [Candidatus Taylorbacteria bacterium]|nr:phosphoglycerate kinase [Candidatus Taylorbacteria bacterium]
MKTLRDIENLQGVRVLLRAAFDVPVRNGMVVDEFRIKAALPTIEYLRSRGAKVILASHIEVLEGEKATLEPVAVVLNKLGVPVTFVKDYKRAFDIIENQMKGGECILLENLRVWDGEKKNDKKFARELASLADIYVNDAFSVCHREHASIVGVPAFIPGYAGLQTEKEVENLSKAFNPTHPFLFILGGAKFETKMPLVNKFLGTADTIFVGGALANDFFKAKGYETGQSLLSKGDFDLRPLLSDQKVLIPVDIIDQNRKNMKPDQLSNAGKILDIGPESIKIVGEKINGSKFILWNGPMGLYEEGFKQATLDLARMIGEATSRGVTTIVGGGDTIAAIAELGMEEKFTFISTAGGAMLEFLTKGTLPGIETLK